MEVQLCFHNLHIQQTFCSLDINWTSQFILNKSEIYSENVVIPEVMKKDMKPKHF